MTQQSWHRAQSQNPDLEGYEIRYHQRQARFLADPSGFCAPDTDVVGTLPEAAEALDDDDLTPMRDSDLDRRFAEEETR